jgi:hypothetical protein
MDGPGYSYGNDRTPSRARARTSSSAYACSSAFSPSSPCSTMLPSRKRIAAKATRHLGVRRSRNSRSMPKCLNSSACASAMIARASASGSTARRCSYQPIASASSVRRQSCARTCVSRRVAHLVARGIDRSPCSSPLPRAGTTANSVTVLEETLSQIARPLPTLCLGRPSVSVVGADRDCFKEQASKAIAGPSALLPTALLTAANRRYGVGVPPIAESPSAMSMISSSNHRSSCCSSTMKTESP